MLLFDCIIEARSVKRTIYMYELGAQHYLQIAFARSKASGQPAHSHILRRTSVVHPKKALVFGYP